MRLLEIAEIEPDVMVGLNESPARRARLDTIPIRGTMFPKYNSAAMVGCVQNN